MKNDENQVFIFLNESFLYRKIFHSFYSNSSFDGDLFLNFYFHITTPYFLSSQFLIFLHEKCSVTISKVHYESIFLLRFIHNLLNDF